MEVSVPVRSRPVKAGRSERLIPGHLVTKARRFAYDHRKRNLKAAIRNWSESEPECPAGERWSVVTPEEQCSG